MNVAGLLAQGAIREPARPAWTFGDRSASYDAFGDRVAGLAAGLVRMGLKPGDRLVLLLPNTPELVEALFAALWAGLVAVPLNWHLHPREVSYVVEHCAAAAILVAPETATAVEDSVVLLTTAAPESAVADRIVEDGRRYAWIPGERERSP